MNPVKIASLLTLLGLTACQKVIDLKLKNDSGKYVIEGNVTNQPGPYQVTIGKTDAVDADYSLQGVSQATVIISDNAGFSETLQETAPGLYLTKTLQGAEGRTYYLDISVGATHLTATSVMPHPVTLDSLYIEEVFNFSKTVKAVVPLFTDPAGQGNSYRFNQTINGNLDKTLYYQNDDFTDGKTSTWSLLRPDADSTLHSKDVVSVEMQCIDAPMYKYWYSVDMSSTGNGSTIASNPVTNIVGGGLGYFSAHTSERKGIVVP
ncbi:MAG TPA: DUF4249 domain-containing protein [Puia sp.]